MHSVRLLTLIVLTALHAGAQAHGSVTAGSDLCVIEIGYFRAHFKIHLPRTRRHEEFCEDLPEAGEAIFVMEYIHGDLGRVPVEFRIIRNVTGMGRFAQLGDVEKIADLESATVFHHPATIQQDVFTVLHDFKSTGEFIGIVTTQHPETRERYSAVFPFEVGYTRSGLIPLFILLLLVAQGAYWIMNRGKRGDNPGGGGP